MVRGLASAVLGVSVSLLAALVQVRHPGRVIVSSDHATQIPTATCQATTWMWLTA
jgi:hypothetical protein